MALQLTVKKQKRIIFEKIVFFIRKMKKLSAHEL
jgi:hypothetical protein